MCKKSETITIAIITVDDVNRIFGVYDDFKLAKMEALEFMEEIKINNNGAEVICSDFNDGVLNDSLMSIEFKDECSNRNCLIEIHIEEYPMNQINKNHFDKFKKF